MRFILLGLTLSGVMVLPLTQARADAIDTVTLIKVQGLSTVREATFSLPVSPTPSYYFPGSPGNAPYFEIFNVPVLNVNPDGTTLSDLETVIFGGPDGDIQTMNIDIRTESMAWMTGTVADPTLVSGSYLDVLSVNGSKVVIAAAAAPTVPEPSGLALLGTGAVGVAGMARRRWRGAKADSTR